MRINKYISSSGFCSRRKAEFFITNKLVKINNCIVTSLSYIVKDRDVVQICKKKINLVKKKIYLMINKPSKFIVSNNDPYFKNNIFNLLPKKILEKFRIYSIGRLDVNSTGVLLLTNDGYLTNRLLHPRYGVEKIYFVVLNKKLKYSDLQKIKMGVNLHEGIATVDKIYYFNNKKFSLIVKIHIGWNKVIRRIFDVLSYKVVCLHRLSFANIEIGKLNFGNWRFLKNYEINNLQNLIKNEKNNLHFKWS